MSISLSGKASTGRMFTPYCSSAALLKVTPKLVIQSIPKAQFLIVGPYDEEKPDALRPEVAERYGVAANCRFVGMRDDMPELYALMDLLVLPSYREGFPRAPMEASAMGVPALVTDIRGCREAVEHGENGLRFPVGDSDALAYGSATASPRARRAMAAVEPAATSAPADRSDRAASIDRQAARRVTPP